MLRKLDLNLLVVFDAVNVERSVTKAAARLNMSQPAVSHALERLRAALQDDLFVRSPSGMVPTARAGQLAPVVRQAIQELGAVLDADPFDPANSDRAFTVAANNYAAIVLVSPILLAAARQAPTVKLVFRPSGTLDVGRLLERGDLDLALVNPVAEQEGLVSQTILNNPFVALMRRNHPAARRLTLPLLSRYPHLEISSSGEDARFVERALAAEGLPRRVGVVAPFLAAPRILLATDMIAIVSHGIAAGFADLASLAVTPLPLPGPQVTLSAVWHARNTRSAAHSWLRRLVGDAASSLANPPEAGLRPATAR